MKAGDKKTILNQDLNGNVIIEGEATLVKEAYSNFDDVPAWMVSFGREAEGEAPVHRYIYTDEEVEEARKAEAERKEQVTK